MASELIWKRLSEGDRKEIEKKAKKIMDDFAKTLEKLPVRKEGVVEREIFEREEGDGRKCDSDFRDLMFENASKKDKEFIIAEKGSWIK